MKKLLMMAICLMVLVGTALSSGLSVYPPVPGLTPSEFYSFRVREINSSQWQSPFAWITRCVDLQAAEASVAYHPNIAGFSNTYCNFEMGDDVWVEVEITRLNPNTGQPVDIKSATPHPRRKVRSWRVENGKAYVIIDHPMLFAVDIDGQMDEQHTGKGYNGPPVHTVTVFANPFIPDKPDPNDSDVYAVHPGETPPDTGTWDILYFMPGVHDIGMDYRLRANKNYYIPGDAMVHGTMNNGGTWDGTDIRIFGHGTLSGERILHPRDDPEFIPGESNSDLYRPIEIRGAFNTTVEGITITDSPTHSLMLIAGYSPERPTDIRWVKIFTWRINGDGINPFRNGLIEDCFIRTQDDGVYINGRGIRRTVFWNDHNGSAFVLTSIDGVEHPHLYIEDCDIIYQRASWERWGGGRVFNMRGSGSGAGGHNVTFRNIYASDPSPTLQHFCMGNSGHGWFSRYLDSDKQRGPGDISGIRFENIRMTAPSFLGEPEVFWGYSEARFHSLVFENVVMAGQKFTSINDFLHNEFVFDFTFENTAPQTMTFLNTSGYDRWCVFGDWDTGVEPTNNDIANHTSFAGPLRVDGPAYAGSLNVSHPEGAVVRIEHSSVLAVTNAVTLGGQGEPGYIQLIDGTLEILNSNNAALSVTQGHIHFAKGTLRWAGNQIDRIQELYDSGAFTLRQGQSDGHSDTATLIAREGQSTLYAEFDESSGYTTVWLTESDQYPYGGTNHTIPGLIEAEHYDEGGQGVAYFDTTEKQGDLSFRPDDDVDVVAREDASNGYVVSYTSEGEWLEYTVDVEAGNYDVTLYYYCGETPGDLLVSLNQVLLETISGMQNQGWDKLDSITVENVFLPTNATGRILRLEFANGAGFDIDAIRFKKQHTPVSGVTLEDCPGNDLVIGNTWQLTATTVPYYADDKTVSWESSDDSVATVDSTGMVTAISEGTATITATTRDGGFTDACEINTDIERIPVYGLTIGGCPNTLLNTGDTHQLIANVAPEDATDKSVTWSSSNPNIATVDENGLITAISQGSVIITATTNDGGFTRTCSMGIRSSGISVTGVTLSGCPEGALEADSTYQLMAHVAPSNAGDLRVSWSSSDETVATVDEDGWITPVSAGEATIIATTHDGDFTAECSVTVDGSTTVRQIDGAGQFVELFPNPASDLIHLRFSESASEKAISIFNTKGQLLFSKKTYSSKTQIDIREFHSESMLIVKVISDGITASFKVIKE